jgi:hypothetical protein
MAMWGLRLRRQGLKHVGDRSFDIMDVTEKTTGGKRVLYFDVTCLQAALRRQMGWQRECDSGPQAGV